MTRLTRYFWWYRFALHDNGVGYFRHLRSFERVRRLAFRSDLSPSRERERR